MRSLVNGVLKLPDHEFGVGVASVASRKEVSLKTLCSECLQPVKQTLACPDHSAETVKGYEYTKGQYLVLSSEEIESLAVEKVVRVDRFVAARDLSLVTEKNYWLLPDSVLSEKYWALRDGMLKNRSIGVGVQSMWGKELPCVVSARENGLLLSVVFQAAEIAQNDLTPTDVSPKALKDAERLTKPSKGTPIVVTDKLSDLIASKFDGDVLLETLKKSLKTTPKKAKVKA